MISSASVCLFVLSVLENDWGTCFLSCHILKALVNVFFFIYICLFGEWEGGKENLNCGRLPLQLTVYVAF